MSSSKPSLDALRIDRSALPPERSHGWIWILLVLLLCGAGAWYFFGRKSAPEVQTVVVKEETASAGASSKVTLNASGYVTARRAATVSSKVTGKVTEIVIEEGVEVKTGQLLAKLDDSNVRAGFRLAEAQLESARTALHETRSNLELAEKELVRFKLLVASQAGNQADLDRADAQVKALNARLRRQNAEIGIAEADVAQWKQQVDDTVIVAPFGGVVTSKNAQPGEMISPMSVGGFTRTGICTIVDMTSLEIEVDVNESYINRVTAGQPVEATLDSYPDVKMPAKVIAIIPTADRQKATVKVRVGFEKIDPRTLPDMAVKVAFRGAEAEGKPVSGKIVSVPKSAVFDDNG
ncbi:MAG TPA: efflux RND transporter periplasmic adaptor subunit, partial [Luteolibacter sp.]|nr:efflux RND transporter periplasmic adaptor subunit [Luteolibacter sp.]